MNKHYIAGDRLYSRAYRLYNRLYGCFSIQDSDHPNSKRWIHPLPDGPHNDMPHVGAVILEGWISA